MSGNIRQHYPVKVFAVRIVAAVFALSLQPSQPAGASKLAPLMVAFLPAKGLAADTDRKAAAAAALEALVLKIKSVSTGYLNAFDACILDATPSVASNKCADTSSASVVVSTNVSNIDAKDGTKPIITMVAGTLENPHLTGRLVFTVAQTDLNSGTPATDPYSALKSDFTNEFSNLNQLFGTPTLDSGALSLAGFSPFLQLVPETATDRKYIGILAHYLARQRIQTVPSQFTGTGTALGTATSGSICQNSPRYLHYTVDVQQSDRPLQFKSVLVARGTGQIIDCANPANPVAFRSRDPMSLTTSAGPAASIIAFLTLAFVSHSNSWGYTGAAASSFSNIIDQKADSIQVEQALYDRALRHLVDDLCTSLKQARVLGSGTAAESLVALDTASTGTQPATNGSGNAANVLNLGDLVAPRQAPLECNPAQ